MESSQSTNFTTTRILQWMPIIKVLILCAGSAICFLIAYLNGSVSAYVPFISETGAHLPEMLIFSLVLYFGASAGAVTILYRFIIVRYQVHLMDNRLNKINRTSTIFGFISMIGLVGVAAVPMSTVLWLHLIFAGIHFFFALMYVNLQTFITYYIPGGNTIWNKIRIALCVLLMIFMLSLVIFFPLSHFKWRKATKLAPALKTPNDTFFGLMLTSSMLEWMLYGTFLTIMSSFYFEFRNFELLYGIIPRINEAPAVAEE